MRVTTSTYTDTLASHLQRIGQRQVSLQSQVSSGQRVQKPEDDPIAAGQVLKLRGHSAMAEQYQKNIENHAEVADVTLDTMRSLQKILDRAQEIAFAADGLDSAEDLKSFGVEVNQLLNQAVQFANSSHRGEYILAGTKTNTTPFAATRDGDGNVTEVTFNGNSDLTESEIAEGVLVTSRVSGANSTGTGERGLLTDSRYGTDLFAHLIALRDQLQTGDLQAISNSTRGQLQSDEANLMYHLANNASLQSRLEATLTSTKDQELGLEGEISRRTDIDLAETIVRLNQNQTNYQAALQSAGSVLNLSLLDFLR